MCSRSILTSNNRSLETEYGKIEFSLVLSVRRRTTAITIDPFGRVRVLAPQNSSEEHILAFLHKKAAWIMKHSRARKRNEGGWPGTGAGTFDRILFLGKKHPVVIKKNDKQRGSVVFNGDLFTITLPLKSDENDSGDVIKKLLADWYRKQAIEILGGRVFHYSRIMQVSPEKITVRTQKRLWGSCDSRKKAINLNWQIVMAPPDVMDYIVVHELSHLFHPNHSKRFWDKVAFFMPDFKERKTWLKNNARDMLIVEL